MTIGKKKRKTNGPSRWHRNVRIQTIRKIKVAIRATAGFGLPVTLHTLSAATAILFGEDERVTSKGMLGNGITRRLYFRYSTSKRRRTTRVKPVGSRDTQRKSAAELRVENEDLKKRLENSEAARLAQIAKGRAAALEKATEDGRRRRRAAPAHTPPAVIDADPGRLKRVRGPRSRG